MPKHDSNEPPRRLALRRTNVFTGISDRHNPSECVFGSFERDSIATAGGEI